MHQDLPQTCDIHFLMQEIHKVELGKTSVEAEQKKVPENLEGKGGGWVREGGGIKSHLKELDESFWSSVTGAKVEGDDVDSTDIDNNKVVDCLSATASLTRWMLPDLYSETQLSQGDLAKE
jgi:hypothetical protein